MRGSNIHDASGSCSIAPLRHATTALFLLLATSAFGPAQAEYAETLWVHVTCYDYHATGSNPNFEPSAITTPDFGIHQGMIQNSLTADRKPILKANVCFNNYINNWWRPSGSSGTGATFTISASPEFAGTWLNLKHYTANGRQDEWIGQNWVDAPADSMTNIVIYDSLPFTLVDATTGTYQYNNQAFFPLDGRGFGGEPATYPPYGWTNVNNDNFGFALEIHRSFTYRPGLVFAANGDDDVWCFINGNLVMDLGGIHGTSDDTVHVDQLGLTAGNVYTLDYFQCERQVTGSDILLTTNIVSQIPPRTIVVRARPDSTVPTLSAGDSVLLWAQVFDGPIERTDLEDSVQWAVISGPPGNLGLSKSTGDSVYFRGTIGDTVYTVSAVVCYAGAPRVCDSAHVSIRVLRATAVRSEAMRGDVVSSVRVGGRPVAVPLSSSTVSLEVYSPIGRLVMTRTCSLVDCGAGELIASRSGPAPGCYVALVRFVDRSGRTLGGRTVELQLTR